MTDAAAAASSTPAREMMISGDRVSLIRGALDDGCDAGDRIAVQAARVDLVNQLGRAPEVHLGEHHLGQQRLRTAPVELPDDGVQRGPANPEAAALVAEQVAPAAGARRAARGVAAVGDRSRPGHDHDSGLIARARDQRDQRVVDDQRPRLESDAAHDPAHGRGVGLAIDAGNAETDGRRLQIPIAERLFHHRVQDLLELEFARRLQVGAAAARLGDDAPALVRKQTDRLRSASVDAQDVHVDS